MANPVRFPAGLSTFAPRSTLGTYPIGTSPRQIAITDDFIPYRAGDYTVTTAVAGTTATFGWLSGAVKQATSASATDTIYNMRLGAAFQPLLGNQLWFDTKLAYPRSVANANDTNIYCGLFDNAVPTSANNGIYFVKPFGQAATGGATTLASTSISFTAVTTAPSPGQLVSGTGIPANTYVVSATTTTAVLSQAATATGSSLTFTFYGTGVNFVIKKAGTTTTFTNVADLALPSGLYNDAASVNGVLSSTVAGGAFSAVTISTAGSGYQTMPLVLTTTTSGVAGNVPILVQLGSTAFNTSNPSLPVQSTALPYGSLAIPYVANPGSGYTNAGPVTTYLEAEPLIDLQFWIDPKGVLQVGVNGRTVLKIEGTATSLGVVGIAAGGNVNLQTSVSNTFYSATQLSTSVAPFQPPVGNAFNLLPMVPMNYNVGFANTTANIRTLYVMEYNVGVELN